MKKYTYQARTQQGKKVKGIVEAPGEKEAVAALRQRSLIVTELKELTNSLNYKLKLILSHVGFNDVVNFTRQLSTMITAGLTLTESLALLESQSNPAMSKIVSDLLLDVQSGQSLFKAMEKHPKAFSSVYLALIRSGEAAGVLDDVLKKMADNLEKERDFRSKVKGALVYPVIVVIGMVLVAIVMMVFVLPKMLEMYQEFDAELPTITRILIGIITFTQHFWLVVIGLIIGLIYAFKLFTKTPAGRQKWDRLKLKLPITGLLLQKVILTNVTRTLGMLVGAGVSIIEALSIVSGTANNVLYQEALLDAAKSVEKGLPLASAINRYELFPVLVGQMVSVGEETGKLDETLLRLSKQFEAESEIAVKALTTAIEPLMMVVLGVGVGFLVLAIILPIYNLTASF